MCATANRHTEMAGLMHTSCAVINSLPNADDTGVTLGALARVSLAVGLPLEIGFGPA